MNTEPVMRDCMITDRVLPDRMGAGVTRDRMTTDFAVTVA